MLPYIHSDQICPSIVISDVATQTLFETSTAGVETQTGGAPIEHHQEPQRTQ